MLVDELTARFQGTSNTFTYLKLANDSLRTLKLVSLEGQRRLRLLHTEEAVDERL